MTNKEHKVSVDQIYYLTFSFVSAYLLPSPLTIIIGLFGASAGVKGSGKNDRSAASKGSPKPPSRAAESTQSQTQQQQQRQASSNVNFNSGSPSAAKFWSSFFQQQQQQQSAEDFASWSQDSYEYDDVEADAEEYFQDTVDYRIYGRPNSRSNGDSRYAAADGSVTGLMVTSLFLL